MSGAHGVQVRPCKRCGMRIEFHVGPNGKPIPLQRIRTLYWVRDGRAVKHDAAGEPFYVSHFETCPNAGEFSRKGQP